MGKPEYTKMKTINIPLAFHEILGVKTTVLELLLVLVVSIAGLIAMIIGTRPDWAGLEIWRTIIFFFFTFDVFAGVVSNLTYATNDYYANLPSHRTLFIAIHVQPLIFAFLFADYYLLCVLVWGYTIVSAYVVNYLKGFPAQRTVGGALLFLGLLVLLLFSSTIPLMLLIALAFYMAKVIYCFAVDHYAPRLE